MKEIEKIQEIIVSYADCEVWNCPDSKDIRYCKEKEKDCDKCFAEYLYNLIIQSLSECKDEELKLTQLEMSCLQLPDDEVEYLAKINARFNDVLPIYNVSSEAQLAKVMPVITAL